MNFKTGKAEDTIRIVKIDPSIICTRAGVHFDIVYEEDTVFVDNLLKIATYFGFKLHPQVDRFFFGGWWWSKNE